MQRHSSTQQGDPFPETPKLVLFFFFLFFCFSTFIYYSACFFGGLYKRLHESIIDTEHITLPYTSSKSRHNIMEKPLFPQALTTSFFSRVKNENTSLYITTQTSRGTKRNATVVNYAEDYFEDFDDYEDDDNNHRHNSLASNRVGYINQINGEIIDPNNTTGNALLNHFSGKFASKTPHAYHSEFELIRNAGLPEALIPIRINIEHQNSRIVDHFMWNLNESLLTPEKFAEIMCLDLDLPLSVQSQIASSITSQIEEYSQLVHIQLPEDVAIHVIIDLSMNLDKQLYEDKFEWDLSSSNGFLTPEKFAEIVVADLGLAREFYPAIAHVLHESIIKLKKDAIEGRLPQEILNGAAYGREAGWRFDPENLGQEWSPSVETLSQWEIEKREIERERNIRRLKRETMRIEGETTSSRGRRRGTRRYDELEGTWVNY